MVILGTIFQAIVMATFFPWYDPRTVFLVVVAVISAYYLLPRDFDPMALLSMVSRRRMSTAHFRHLLLASLLIPTWLEARTLGYLSQVLSDAGWGYNFLFAILIAGVLAYRRKMQPRLPLRQQFYTALYILYGGAFWVSLLHFRIGNIPNTAGPFLLASGTLLLTESNQRQYTRALRHTLRLTLRDTLAAVSDNVHEDEMLQLAMLRWIVEYWSTRPDAPDSTVPPPSTEVVEAISPVTGNPAPIRLRTEPQGQHRATDRPSTKGEEIQWNDLLPMLDMTADQMEEEVCHSPNCDANTSLESLRQMLASMDVDEHALPAVNAYKQAVQDIPPGRMTALSLSVLRRCPASLLLIWRFLTASPYALPSTLTLLSFIFLESYRVIYWAEVCHSQADDGQHDPNRPLTFERIISIPIEIDSMTLLLSRETLSWRGPSTLLQVWFNVQASVRALETGLSAARCAQTTVAAADFANNLMSLAELGCEFSQKGWIHGLGILAQELINMQVGSREGHYIGAARGALKNSQKIARNLHVLAIEDAPIVAFLQTIVGRGWLWGHGLPLMPVSTVVITELTEGEEVDTDEAHDVGSASKAEEQQRPLDASKALISNWRGREFDSTSPLESNLLVKRPSGECGPCTAESLTDSLNDSVQQMAHDSRDEREVIDLLELMSSVHERGMISDAVKASFEAMLSGEPTTAVVENVMRSLNRIVEKGDFQPRKHCFEVGIGVQSDDDDRKGHETGSWPIDAGVVASESEQGVPEAVVGVLNRGPSSDMGSSAPEDMISDGASLALSETQGVEQDVLVLTPMISNQSSWEETPFTESLTPKDTLGSTSWEAFPSSILESSNDEASSSEISHRPHLEPDVLHASQFPHRDDESDVKKWVGGGLAILGAVIGTVALHNANRGEGNDERRGRRHSIGRVVELSSELDDDGWVSV